MITVVACSNHAIIYNPYILYSYGILMTVQEEDGVLSMPVVSKHGQLYSCSLPSLAHITEMKETETESSVDTLPNITTLLKPLADQDCLIKVYTHCIYNNIIIHMNTMCIAH